MDVLFFNPPRSRQQHDHVLNTTLLWLASSLRADGLAASIRAPSGMRLEEEVVGTIEVEQPRFAAIACKWWNTLYGALRVASVIRRHFPHLPIVVGGHTASTFPAELIATGLIDIVLLGDVDHSLTHLAVHGEVSHGVTSCGYHPPVTNGTRASLLDDIELEPIHRLIDQPDIVPGYVWLGRGCCHPCFYCLESRDSGMRIMGRGAPRMRQVAAVARDAAALAGRSQLIFDYEHPSTARTERFLSDLGAALPQSFRSCYYFHWGLPTPAIIDALSERFDQVGICLDIQVFAAAHRHDLSCRKLIKPYVSDEAIRGLLQYVERKSNVHVDATGIVGMPLETTQHREQGLAFIESLSRDFACVRDWRFSPLHVIPGTPLAGDAHFLDLDVLRRSFQDFYEFTKESYESEVGYYSTERALHPYGVHPAGQKWAIVDFMKDASARLDESRSGKRSVVIKRTGASAAVDLTDPFTPLPTLFAALADRTLRDFGAERLTISLGPRTWFHHSWMDYSSESGENSATKCGLARDAAVLEAQFRARLAPYKKITLAAAPRRWGVIADVVASLTRHDRQSAIEMGSTP